ncbi:dihydrolipoyl dehydrogenase family protein [Blastococcus capsensis]|uniref:dihydrolipoyl dehydrogenase family protein n=1 Tax=Blastococcus capsensis TaxID=1564163 RepID=UPI00254200A5|nr:NAD(P)/FAD-dependent oxidoreductase [Blastococcus capsensis]MDK3258733.1 NAD(P)/FAD-dependent oxidoreductase [Blastococcus capsensis]
MSTTYDVIVLGAGSTGTNVAWYARDNGLSVAVVERELVGGECSYWACIPSKALLGPTHALAAARRLPGAAEAVTGDVDADAVLRRRDEFISHLHDDGQVQWLDGIDATLIRGQGRLTGEREVTVTSADGATQQLLARRAVVVATGSRAATPPVDGLDEIRPWDNRDVTTAKDIPDRLLVLGGGVAGCEMAQAYRRLGAREVTVVERSERLVGGFEPWAGELLADAFRAEGITVLTGRSVDQASRDGVDGPVTIALDDGTELVADELLVAAGRTSNTDDLGLDTVGLEPGGPLHVDDQLRVTAVEGGWLYAAGDVNGRALLTHQGKYQARLVGDIVAGKQRSAWADHTAVPQVMFTDPELAAVGQTEQQARDAGIDVKTVSYEIGSVAGGALLGDDVRGRAQLVIDQQQRVVVGATFVGPNVGEMLHAATIAVVGKVPIDTLWHAVPAFPTVSEVWLRLLEADRGL